MLKEPNKSKISIIVPIHNGLNYTLKFLDSLKALSYNNYETIIVDDGSTDGSFEAIKSKYPSTIILKGDGTLWWTKSINLAVRYVLENNLSDYIFTLNNDVILDENILKAHVECLKDNPKALIGSKVYFLKDKDKVWFGGGSKQIFKLPSLNDRPFGTLDDHHYQNLREVEWLTGMGAMIPVEVFKTVGFYNEKILPQYYADAELSLRAKKQGYKLLFNPKAMLWNDVESSWWFPREINFKTIYKTFFHFSSPYYIKAIFYVHLNYWPLGLGFIPISLTYTSVLTAMAKRFVMGCLRGK